MMGVEDARIAKRVEMSMLQWRQLNEDHKRGWGDGDGIAILRHHHHLYTLTSISIFSERDHCRSLVSYALASGRLAVL